MHMLPGAVERFGIISVELLLFLKHIALGNWKRVLLELNVCLHNPLDPKRAFFCPPSAHKVPRCLDATSVLENVSAKFKV